MKKTIIVIIILLVIGFGIYYFTSNNNSSVMTVDNSQLPPAGQPASNAIVPTPGADNTTPVSNTPAKITSSGVNVSINNFSFNPGALTIKTGTNIIWVNNDSVSHSVTSDSGLFDSGTLDPGASFSYTFTTAGVAGYHCSIHPNMKGTVTVQN